MTGSLGFVWLFAWLALYRQPEDHPRVRVRAGAHQERWPVEPSPGAVAKLFSHRATWAFALGKFMTDPIWWFYLFWLPKFLDAGYGMQLAGLAAPLIVIYLLADVGSIVGGWLSGAFIKRGGVVNVGRKAADAHRGADHRADDARSGRVEHVDRRVDRRVAAASHQWWSCNIFTMPSDMFPKSAVASVIGIGGFAGAMSAMLMQRATGRLLDASAENYGLIFGICGTAYLLALGAIHLLVPRIRATTDA